MKIPFHMMYPMHVGPTRIEIEMADGILDDRGRWIVIQRSSERAAWVATKSFMTGRASFAHCYLPKRMTNALVAWAQMEGAK